MHLPASERYFLFLKYGYITALFAHIVFALLFQWLGLNQLVYVNLISILVYAIALWMLYKGYYCSSLLLVSIEIVLHACAAVFVLGWESGFHYYLFTLMMASAFNPYWSVISKLGYAATISLGYIALGHYASIYPSSVVLDPMLLQAMHAFNAIFAFVFIGYLAHVYAKSTSDAEDKLRQLAATDPLTGLHNRREFLRLFDFELIKNRRSQLPFAMIMVDIDDFKTINDTFGHQCGDEAIIAVSDCFRKNVREQDHIARWGGEEFVLLLPETDMDGAIVLAEKLFDAVRDLSYSCGSRMHKISITLSVGVHQHHETRDQLLFRVDHGLMRGKETGKNQIVCV